MMEVVDGGVDLEELQLRVCRLLVARMCPHLTSSHAGRTDRCSRTTAGPRSQQPSARRWLSSASRA